MTSYQKSAFALLTIFLCGSNASASSILDGWAFNIDGIFTSSIVLGTAPGYPVNDSSMPATVNHVSFSGGTIDSTSGLVTGDANGQGSLTFSVTGVGSHQVVVFFDHHLAALPADYYVGDYGTRGAVPPASAASYQQFWEIGDPYLDPIHSNASYGATFLTNTIDYWGQINAGLDRDQSICCDIALALGYTFNLNAGQVGNFSFRVGEIDPGGFRLMQGNDSYAPIFFDSSFNIVNTSVPEPAGWALMTAGLASAGLFRVRSRSNRNR
jgi:hypothetical protein